MDSSRPRQALLWSGVIVLPIAAGLAGALLHQDGARAWWMLAGCACAGMAALAAISRGVSRLSVAPRLHAAPAILGQSAMTAQARHLLALESYLEFAPIALFRLVDHAAPWRLEALNASARRLLAPGRVTDEQALMQTLQGLATGRRSLIEFDSERGPERALASATALTVNGVPQRVLALMPVEDQLEAEAMQAWQKLVNVLTHEIMNSLTPVVSLSRTARDLLREEAHALPPELAQELDVAMDAVTRRADSLIHFVSGYRSLASVPEARLQRIVVKEMFTRLEALHGASWQIRGGRAEWLVDSGTLELLADPGQVEQALLNLVQNASEATASVASPILQVHARATRGGRLRIEVRDNGPGIPDDLAPSLFTPFFSTKGKGRGIGLALVRQLLHRNGGSVRYARSMGGGARFVITF